MKPRYVPYLTSFLVGVGIVLLGGRLGRALDLIADLGLFGILTIAFLIGHCQRREWRAPHARLSAVTATSLVSLVVTAIAFIAYVFEFFIRGGGR
jgi:hypothetical protein